MPNRLEKNDHDLKVVRHHLLNRRSSLISVDSKFHENPAKEHRNEKLERSKTFERNRGQKHSECQFTPKTEAQHSCSGSVEGVSIKLRK